MPVPRLLILLCAVTATNTSAAGAFPPLLPELGASAGLADWQLGLVAGAWGFARMLADVPIGLFMTHHLRRALPLGPALLATGAVVLVAGGPFVTLVFGRWLMGTGHALGMLGSLTAILLHAPPGALASWLNALELSAMLGMIGGVGVLVLLPRGLPWSAAYLVACAPILVSIALLPALLRALPREARDRTRPLFARSARPAAGPAPGDGRAGAGLGALAFAAGGAVAMTYASVEQFGIPLRTGREFGLDRAGIARLLLLMQACDVAALLPVGALADRLGTARVLGVILVVFAAAIGLIAFGPFPLVLVGCALFGLSMAGWMLPLGVLRSVTPPERVAWRTALYRVGVDAGLFLGPVLGGLLVAGGGRVLDTALGAALATVGILLLRRTRLTGPAPSG
jgi:MFS family permease